MSQKNRGSCVIYLLTNIINNKIYVGQTWMLTKYRMGKNILMRWAEEVRK